MGTVNFFVKSYSCNLLTHFTWRHRQNNLGCAILVVNLNMCYSVKCAFLGDATFTRMPIDHQHGEHGISRRVWRACKGSILDILLFLLHFLTAGFFCLLAAAFCETGGILCSFLLDFGLIYKLLDFTKSSLKIAQLACLWQLLSHLCWWQLFLLRIKGKQVGFETLLSGSITRRGLR